MKKIILLLSLGILLPLPCSFGQDEGPQPRTGGTATSGGLPGRGGRGGGRGSFGFGPAREMRDAFDTTDTNAVLMRFDLNFVGGNPGDLVAAIQKASGRPLNAIVPDEYSHVQLPPLKMRGVTVPELFQALLAASRKVVPVITSMNNFGGGGGRQPSYTYQNVAFGFRTEGAPREDSIWYFYYDEPAKMPTLPEEAQQKICRFYALARYLDQGYKVEDITTAIQTGWNMLGQSAPPQMTYHKDTKLLIAVGDPGSLQLIDAALEALNKPIVRENQRSPGQPSRAGSPTNSPPFTPQPVFLKKSGNSSRRRATDF